MAGLRSIKKGNIHKDVPRIKRINSLLSLCHFVDVPQARIICNVRSDIKDRGTTNNSPPCRAICLTLCTTHLSRVTLRSIVLLTQVVSGVMFAVQLVAISRLTCRVSRAFVKLYLIRVFKPSIESFFSRELPSRDVKRPSSGEGRAGCKSVFVEEDVCTSQMDNARRNAARECASSLPNPLSSISTLANTAPRCTTRRRIDKEPG